ncbi:MAG: hypothetical protein DRO39_03050 [Thermoprotei archaeon]|nr:MAG: hypothetical protein DRO39_03050 [Thermoprotei archaeon]
MKSTLELRIRGFSRVKYSNEYVELELLKPTFEETMTRDVDTERLEESLDSLALSILGTKPDVDFVEIETRVDNTTYVYSTSRFVSRDYTPVLIAPRPSRVHAIYVAPPGDDGVSIDLTSEPPRVFTDELYVYETPIIVKSGASNRVLVVESNAGTFVVDLSALPSRRISRGSRKSRKAKRKRRKRCRSRKRRTKTTSSS